MYNKFRIRTAKKIEHLFENQCKINLEILYDKRSVLDLVGTCHNFRDEAKVQTSLLAVSEDGALRGWILNGDKEEETHQWRNLMIENNQMKRAKVRFQNYCYRYRILLP